MEGIKHWLMIHDVVHGVIKSVVFGLIISLIACYRILRRRRGQRSRVGYSKSVVATRCSCTFRFR